MAKTIRDTILAYPGLAESCMPFPVDKDLKALMSFIRFV